MPLKFVLITPARNEAEFIESTIQSVIAQTCPPLKWVIVSDGSTDGTDEIVQKYLPDHPRIELVRMPDRVSRDFASKVHAFNAGYSRVRDVDYEVIGSLDADVTFDKDYFAFLLQKLADDPGLGLVGTPVQEGTRPIYDYRFVSIEHVSGACQLFRRSCFEAISGYVPVKGGSVDHIAVISSRMKGWKTRTFADKVCVHHREMGTAQQGTLTARFKHGAKDYAVGNSPLWELFRIFYQLTKPPFLLGGLAIGSGYLWSWLRGHKRPVSPEFVAFHQQEQMERLKNFFGRRRVSSPGELRQYPTEGV
jgi:glycosyltransferase involved in cell wall biosynthesis